MEKPQFVRFLFLRVDPAWRRLEAGVQRVQKQAFVGRLKDFRARLLLRGYSLVGTRGDTDLLLWQVADDLDPFQQLETTIFSTALGGWLTISHSYLGMARRSVYELPDGPGQGGVPPRIQVEPQDCKYLFVYPFVKQREWYVLPLERRQALMEEHIRTGRKYPNVRLNTIYSFGLDDQEFVLAFESDDASAFVDLVMDLRHTEASRYTLQDTPIFTCLQMSLHDILDSLGGAGEEGKERSHARDRSAGGTDPSGFTEVATLAEVPTEGSGRRVYLGAEAIALFRINGQVFAVSDRCSHGRASLSEGTVEAETCTLQCPWHGGRYDLASGRPAGGPVRVPIRTYRVRLDGDRILVG